MTHPTHDATTVALTGATGFVGRSFLKHAIAKGFHVRALTRAPQPHQDGVTWIEGALDTPASLRLLCEGADHIVHIAGAIKAKNRAAYLRVNEEGTKAMLGAATESGLLDTGHFIHVSSLAAREPAMSSYAFSKHKAETAVQNSKGQWTILRPPAVYGPDDMETLKLFKAMKMGYAPIAGSKHNRFSLIHVDDLATALCAMIGKSQTYGQTYEISDGHKDGYRMQDVAAIVAKALNTKVRALPLPALLVTSVGAMNDLIAPLLGVVPMLGREKARELLHPDWVSRTPLFNDSGLWSPAVQTEDGLRDTIQSYKQSKKL